MNGNGGRAAVAALLIAFSAAWGAEAFAQSSACVLGSERKVCASIAADPGDRVQPSGEAGTPTYVRYDALVRNLTQTVTRFVSTTMTLSPQSTIVSASSSRGSCTISGSRAHCVFDKLQPGQVVLVTATAQVPPYASPTQPDYPLVNTMSFGWQGNQSTVQASVQVSVTGGKSYVPPGSPEQSIVLATCPPADPSEQASPGTPVCAKWTIPQSPTALTASLAVVNDGPLLDCAATGGFFVGETVEDAGVYVCRDQADGKSRWVRAELSQNVLFDAAHPMRFDLYWDASIVPPTQLAPELPPFAVFYRGEKNDASTPPTRAFARSCLPPLIAPPCLAEVTHHATGDWSAALLKTEVSGEDGTPLAPAPAASEAAADDADVGIDSIVDPPIGKLR